MRLSEIETKRAQKLNELKALLDVRDQASREFTADEATRFDALEAEVEQLNTDHARELKAENIRKQTALDRANVDKPEVKAAKKVSIARAISMAAGEKTLDGIEGELSQEGIREMQNAGGRFSGKPRSFVLPSFMLNYQGPNVMRDLTSGGAATGEELVSDDFKGHIYGLNIRPKVLSLGATMMPGLSGDVYFTKTGTAAAVWETENAAADETTISTARVALTPKRLAAFSDISGTLITQTNGAGEMYAKQEISTAISVALDAAAINGSGSAPTGLLGMSSGINSVVMGTDGGNPLREHLLEMVKLIEEDNADLGSLAFLTTPGIKYWLRNLKTDAGSGQFVWDNNSNLLLGYNAETSTNVPSTLTKGASASICHAILLGVWNQMIIGQWGGAEIVVNPYTRIKENIIELVVNTNFDIDVRHEQAFCYIKDALAS